MRHIYGEQEKLWTLANCNLASIGEFYQHLRQVLRHVYAKFYLLQWQANFAGESLARICDEQKYQNAYLVLGSLHYYRNNFLRNEEETREIREHILKSGEIEKMPEEREKVDKNGSLPLKQRELAGLFYAYH